MMTGDTVGEFSWARTTSWLVSANILRNVGLLAILVVLARLTNPDVVGQYALALAITTPAFVFALLGLKTVYLTVRSVHRYSAYAIVGWGGIILATGVSVAAAAIFAPPLLLTVFLVSVVKAAECLNDLFSGPLQRYHRAQLVFWANLTSAFVGGFVVVVLLLVTGDLNIALVGLGLCSIAIGVLLAGIPAWRLTSALEKAHPEESVWRDSIVILRAGVPFGIASSILALVSSMPQYFLAAIQGHDAVGYFAVVLYLLAAADLFTATLAQAWIPRGRIAFEAPGRVPFEFLRAVLRISLRWFLICVPIVVAGLALAALFLPVVFGPDYRLTIEVAVPLGLAIMVLPFLHFAGTSLSVRNLYIHSITLSVVSAVTSVVGCLVLIPLFSVVGALWATLFALLARGLAAIVVLLRQERAEARAASHAA